MPFTCRGSVAEIVHPCHESGVPARLRVLDEAVNANRPVYAVSPDNVPYLPFASSELISD